MKIYYHITLGWRSGYQSLLSPILNNNYAYDITMQTGLYERYCYNNYIFVLYVICASQMRVVIMLYCVFISLLLFSVDNYHPVLMEIRNDSIIYYYTTLVVPTGCNCSCCVACSCGYSTDGLGSIYSFVADKLLLLSKFADMFAVRLFHQRADTIGLQPHTSPLTIHTCTHVVVVVVVVVGGPKGTQTFLIAYKNNNNNSKTRRRHTFAILFDA